MGGACRMKRRRMLLLALVLAGTGILTGCRESMNITQVIYDQEVELPDTDNETKMVEDEEDAEEENENLPVRRTGDTTDPDTSDDAGESEDSADGEESDQTADGTEDTDGGGSAKKQTATGDGEGDSEGDAAGETKTTDAADDEDSGKSAGGLSSDPTARQVVNANGEVVYVPENVSTAVAPGAAAVIVQMLGGDGILVGASADVLSGLAATVFSDEGIADAVSYWSGDGSSTMSDANFKKLLAASPDLCVAVSGQSNFSSSQIEQLEENGIGYVTIPELNTSDNILDAVEILGDAIGNQTDSGGQNAKKIAQSYISYTEDLISQVKSDCGAFSWNGIDYNNDVTQNSAKTTTSTEGVYTLYVDGWDTDAKIRLKDDDGTTIYTENGAAIVPNGYSNSPLCYYLSLAGVDNNAAHYSASNPTYYVGMPLNINVLNFESTGSGLEYYKPYNSSFLKVTVSTDTSYYLGEDIFQYVIADSAKTKSYIESSPAWQNYGKVTLGNRTEYGFVSENTIVMTYIRDDYEILVNPYGVCAWTEGSPESVLEAVWAAWAISGDYSESTVKSEIKEFYSTFYRHDLTDAQVTSILNGQ